MYSRTIVESEEKLKQLARILGPEDPELASSISKLAHMYFVIGKYNECEALFWRAMAIISKVNGESDLAVAEVLFDLGYLYQMQEQYAQAEHVYRLAYAIKCQHLGKGHPESLRAARSVIFVCRAQNKFLPEAEIERMTAVA
jgi:tetratricopeptide (TPR) repeat protein